MTVSPTAALCPTPPPGPTVAPTFSLGSALRWLGRQCTHRCSASIESLGATVWFIRTAGSLRPVPQGTLVALDLTSCQESSARIRRLIAQVNTCTRADGIRVCERRGNDHGRALALVASGHRSSRYDYLLLGAAPTPLDPAPLDPARE